MQSSTTANAKQGLLDHIEQQSAALAEFETGIKRLRERVGTADAVEILGSLEEAEACVIEFQRNNAALCARVASDWPET